MRLVAEQISAAGWERDGMWKYVLTSIGTRFLVMSATSAVSLVTTREIISAFGPSAYAQYGLLVSIPALLSFVDLGIGAAIINDVAQADGDQHFPLVPTLLSALRILVIAGLFVMVLVVTTALLSGWPSVLGAGLSAENGNMVATLCLALFGASIPFGVGERVLVGLRRNHLGIAILGLQAPLLLGLILLLARTSDHPTGDFAPLCFFIAYFTVTVLGFVSGMFLLRGRIGGLWKDLLNPRVRGGRVMNTGLPMMINMIAVPIGMNSDRLVLSHMAPADLAEYTLAAQVFLALLSLSHAAGMALWPLFAQARKAGEDVNPFRVAAVIGAVALLCCGAVAALGSYIFGLVSGFRVTVSLGLAIAFSCYVVLQSVNVGLGTYLTDLKGLRFQAVCVAPMLLANLALSIWLAQTWGAMGPVIASALSVGFFQVGPYAMRIRNMRRRDADGPGERVARLESAAGV